MKKALLLFLIVFMLSGCGGAAGDFGPAPTRDDQAGGGNLRFASSTPTPYQPQAPLVMETSVSLMGGGTQALQPGQAMQSGALTFTLQKVQAGKQKTGISYQISGLPADYTAMPGLGNPWIMLPNGTRLEVIDGGGGGSQGSESANYDFPALPAGTKEFHLVIINSWSGAVQTWTVPVQVKQ